jgi:hypothetical protein
MKKILSLTLTLLTCFGLNGMDSKQPNIPAKSLHATIEPDAETQKLIQIFDRLKADFENAATPKAGALARMTIKQLYTHLEQLVIIYGIQHSPGLAPLRALKRAVQHYLQQIYPVGAFSLVTLLEGAKELKAGSLLKAHIPVNPACSGAATPSYIS